MLTGFGFDFGLGFGVFRIGGAGKHEVLPDHDAVAVAQIVELVGFVDAAAPGTHHVGVGLHQITDAAFVVAVSHAGDEGIVRNPVVAVRVHRHVVDVDLEWTTDVVGAGVDMHGTEADMAVPSRFGGIAGSDGNIIQWLISVTDRPPQLRFRYGERQHGFIAAFGDHAVGGDIGTEAGQADMHRHRGTHGMALVWGHDAPLAGTFDLDMHVEQAGAVGGDVDQRTHGGYAHPGPGVDADLAPDAGVGHVDTPIPAEGVARLANLVECMMLGMRIVAAGLLHTIGFAYRRSEGDGQFVGALAKQVTHVPTVGAVEVAGGGDRTAVQCDIGDGVEAVGDQIMPVGAIVMPIEAAGEAPVNVADPLLVVLVGAIERIGDESRIQQVQRGLSRHGSRNASGERFA